MYNSYRKDVSDYFNIVNLICLFDFNNDTDRMETYYRGESEPMPYNTNGTLRVRELGDLVIHQLYGQLKEQCRVGIAEDIYMVLQFL